MTDDEFNLARQLRIAERNKRLSARLIDERRRRNRDFAWWAVALSISLILSGLALTLKLIGHLQ